MKKILFTVCTLLVAANIGFGARTATHNITNFAFNSSANTYSFDVYSQSTGTTAINVGTTSYFFNFNNTSLTNPVFTFVNPNYTGAGAGAGTDYAAMTVAIIGGQIGITITFTGNGAGTGSALATAGPMGELMCSVSLTVASQTGISNLSWNTLNSGMSSTIISQVIISSYFGSDVLPLPVELSSFKANQSGEKVVLNWKTATEVQNAGFGIERKGNNSEWKQIGFLKGAGNSSQAHEYSYKDLPSGDTKFQYRLKQVDLNGRNNYSAVVNVKLEIPANYTLEQNYPNPFNPNTNIKFELPKDSHVTLKVYNMLGQEVAELVNEDFAAGYQSVVFDASKIASGTYLYRLEAGNFVQVKKMIVLK